MKNLIVWLVFASCTMPAFSQEWENISFNPTMNDLHDIVQWSPTHCLTVGNNGIIHRSTDGGNTWAISSQQLTKATLRSVACDKSLAIIVGDNGTILHSLDSGATWQKSASEFSTIDFLAVAVHNTTAFAVGTNGTIIRTTDNGKTWGKLSPSINEKLYNVFCFSSDTIIVVGKNGTLLRSFTQGEQWEKISTGDTSSLYSISEYNGTLCVAGNSRTILFSNDYCSTLQKKPVQGNEIMEFRSIEFCEDSILIGIAAIYIDGYRQSYSTDGGITWTNTAGSGYVPKSATHKFNATLWFCGLGGYAGKMTVQSLQNKPTFQLTKDVLFPTDVRLFGTITGVNAQNLCSYTSNPDSLLLYANNTWSSVFFSHSHSALANQKTRPFALYYPQSESISFFSRSEKSIFDGQKTTTNYYTTHSRYNVNTKQWFHHDFSDTLRISPIGFVKNYAALMLWNKVYFSTDYGTTWTSYFLNFGFTKACLRDNGDIIGISSINNQSVVKIFNVLTNSEQTIPVSFSGGIQSIKVTASSLWMLTFTFKNNEREYVVYQSPLDTINFTPITTLLTSANIQDISMHDDVFGILSSPSTTYITEDGGKTWKEKIFKGLISSSTSSVYIADSRTAFLCAQESLFKYNRIIASTDKNDYQGVVPFHIVYLPESIVCHVSPLGEEIISLSLYSMSGEKYGEFLPLGFTASSGEITIPTNVLPSGVYSIILRTKTKVFSQQCYILK
ncbi:MAG: WD40/YVTN/BNR-like repeat-containing protein [Candidatus Kapaibacterium sp.]|jgi:photosystem II stability/assembly factor-like uncharacterized protein